MKSNLCYGNVMPFATITVNPSSRRSIEIHGNYGSMLYTLGYHKPDYPVPALREELVVVDGFGVAMIKDVVFSKIHRQVTAEVTRWIWRV